jgi:ribonuclease VapC
MADVIMDSSAILADLQDEPGAERVRTALQGSRMSAVNFAEVITKLIERGHSAEAARFVADRIDCDVIEVDKDRAAAAGVLHASTRGTGVSLGDRFCLALARETGWPVLTADRRWATLDLGIEITLIR